MMCCLNVEEQSYELVIVRRRRRKTSRWIFRVGRRGEVVLRQPGGAVREPGHGGGGCKFGGEKMGIRD